MIKMRKETELKEKKKKKPIQKPQLHRPNTQQIQTILMRNWVKQRKYKTKLKQMEK